MNPEEIYEAVSHYVFVIRDEKEEEIDGLIIPDSAQKKPNTGKIISVGGLVEDKRIQVGMKAVFHKSVGGEILLPEITLTVLNQDQVLGVFANDTTE